MAVLQKIRSKNAWLVGSIAMALFIFVVGDGLKSCEGVHSQSKQNIGEIDGEVVSIQDYQKMIDELQVVYEIMYQKSSFDEDELNRIKDEAWQSLVNNALVKKECDALGLAVTDEEVAEIIKTGASPLLQVPFFSNQQTGRYDYTVLQGFLTEYKKLKDTGSQIPEVYEKIYKYYMFAQKMSREQLLASKYQILFSKCFMSNPVEAKMAFEGRTNESDAVIAAIPFSSIEDKDINITDEEIKSKYNEDKERFLQPVETRDIKLIRVQVTASEKDRADAENEMNEIYANLQTADSKSAANIVRSNSSLVSYSNVMKLKEAYPDMIANKLDSATIGQTFKPVYDVMTNTFYTFKVLDKGIQADSVLYRQMVVTGSSDKNDLNAKADSILKAINGGATFKSIAKKYNQEGDSTWIATSQYQGGALDADNALVVTTLYGMNVGETKKVEFANGGVVVFQVIDKKNPVAKYNVASVVKELKFSDDTYNKEYNKFSSFVAANPTLEKIEANAEKQGYHVLPLVNLTCDVHNISNVHNTREIVKWIFDDAKTGDVSQLYECGNNDNLMLVALTGVNQKGYATVEKAKDYITSQLRNEKKAEKIIESLKDVKSIEQASAKNNVITDTVNHISFANPSFISATHSSEPLISAVATKTTKDSFAAPFKGNGGVYMLKVINKTKTAEQFDSKSEEATLANMAMRTSANNLFQDLYMKADVKDLRYKFF